MPRQGTSKRAAATAGLAVGAVVAPQAFLAPSNGQLPTQVRQGCSAAGTINGPEVPGSALGASAAAATAFVAFSAASRRTGKRPGAYGGAVPARTTSSVQRAAEANETSRVVALVGPDGAGKSKVCAALLQLNEHKEGTTFGDKGRYLQVELAELRHQFSCYNHFYSQQGWTGTRLHLIDTPGHVDRQPLVERALEIAHGAVVVCSVKGEIDMNCQRILKTLEQTGKPGVMFLNGVDQADDAEGFDAALDTLERRLGVRPVVLFAPAHMSGHTTGSHLLNVLDGSICSPLGCSLDEAGESSPAALGEWTQRLKEQQIESLAAVDDKMMEAFVEKDGQVSREEIEAALQRAVAAGRVMPVVAGSAKTGIGIDALQQVIQRFLPPDDGNEIMEAIGLQPAFGLDFSVQAPFLGWVFSDRVVDGARWLEVRVLDGVLRSGEFLKVASPNRFSEEFCARKLLSCGPRGILLSEFRAVPGDIVLIEAPPGLWPLGEEGMVLTEPRRPFDPSIEPRTGRKQEPRLGCTYALNLENMEKKEKEALLSALQSIGKYEGLHMEVCKSTGQQLISFRGALHVQLVREKLAEEFRILRLPLGKPPLEYLSTVKSTTAGTGSHNSAARNRIRKGIVQKHVGHQDAWVKVALEPGQRGSGIEIQDPSAVIKTTGFGKEAMEAEGILMKGLQEGLKSAGPGGLPVTDVVVKVLGIQAERADVVLAAAEDAVHDAVNNASQVVLLEPFVQLEVQVADDKVEGVKEDLEHRRGEVWTKNAADPELPQVLEAHLPMREVLDYATVFQNLTQGEGTFFYKKDGYREVPASVAKQIIDEEQTTASPQLTH